MSVELLRALLSRRWLPATAVVLAALFLFIRLGIWQLDRLAQRRAENVALTAVLAAPPADLAGAALPEDLREWEKRLVRVSGRFDETQERYLLLQQRRGQTGVHLITPLVLAEGETAVLVDRGWIPQNIYEAGEAERFRPPDGSVTVEGYVALSRPARQPANERPGTAIYRVDIEAIEPTMPYSLLPLYVVEYSETNGGETPPFQAAREIDLSEGPHLSYAIQWFIFALLTPGLYLLLVRRSRPGPPPPA